MQKNKPAHRAWNLMRIAFLWARKRRIFRRRLITELRLLPNLLKAVNFKHSDHTKAIAYREQQFSFDATPLMNFKKLSPSSMRFKIPCIGRSRVDYGNNYKFDFGDGNNDFDARKSFLKDYYEDENYDHDDGGDDDEFVDCEFFEERVKSDDDDVVDEEEIDVKAESFIAQFYEEMKLQRQFSNARRNEMLNRSIC